MNHISQSVLISIVISSFAASPFVSASSVLSPINPPPLPPPPNMTADGHLIPLPPKPTAPPQALQNQSLPDEYGVVVGKVIEEATGAAIDNALVQIPELKLVTKSGADGTFKFGPIHVGATEQFVTFVAVAPGFGRHTMTDVNIIPKDVATVTLALTKGSKPTSWYGIIRQLVHKKDTRTVDNGPVFSVSLPLSFSSQTTPPPYIRVGMYQLDSKGNQIGSLLHIDTVDFDFYVKHVLPSEWWYNTWSATTTEQLKAGAMAVKDYGWYFVNHEGSAPFDVYNSNSDQVYNPYLSHSTTDQAVDFTSGTGWYQKGVIFESQYQSGSSTAPLTPCDASAITSVNCMTQYGSKYWADHGQSYTWILAHYYTSATPTYFTIAPKWPTSAYEATGTNSSITLNYFSPSSTWYEINQYVNGAWTNLYETQNTSTTIKGLTANTQYEYSVAAYGPGGWSNTSFNNGWISAIAQPATYVFPPITDAFAITTSTIKLCATSTDTHIDSYDVIKWNGSSWDTVYSGMPPTVTSSVTANYDPSPLPDVYIDRTGDAGQSGDGMRGFVYTATSLSASTTYSFSINYHDSINGYSYYSNNNGSLTTVTQQQQ